MVLVDGAVATGGPDALVLDVALNPVTMSRGMRAAAGAPLAGNDGFLMAHLTLIDAGPLAW